jgi:hypothetical protein
LSRDANRATLDLSNDRSEERIQTARSYQPPAQKALAMRTRTGSWASRCRFVLTERRSRASLCALELLKTAVVAMGTRR